MDHRRVPLALTRGPLALASSGAIPKSETLIPCCEGPESTVLLVGPSPDVILDRMRRSLDEAGFTVGSCPAMTMADCPSTYGAPCLVTEVPDAVVVHRVWSDYRPPCADMLDRPGLVVVPPSAFLTRSERRLGRFTQPRRHTHLGRIRAGHPTHEASAQSLVLWCGTPV